MSGREDTTTAGHARLVVPLAVAVLYVMLAQTVRVLFPRVLVLGEDGSYLLVGLLTVLIFASPLLALPFIATIPPRTAILAGGVSVVIARLSVQLVHPIPGWIAFAGPALALAGAAALAAGGSASRTGGRWLTPAVVFGLALDTAIRAPSRTWDLTWQDGGSALVSTVVLAGIALAAVWAASDRPGRGEVPPTSRGPILFALGPYLMVQLLFLQNPGYVGSQGGLGFVASIVVVLVADALAVAATVLVTRRPRIASTLALAALASALGWLVTSASGAGTVALVLVLQIVVTACLAIAFTAGDSPDAGVRRTVLGVTAAALAFAILVLLWMIDIDTPLPFPREAAPAAAAGLVGLAAIARARTRARRMSAEASIAPIPTICAATLAVALVIPGWLWLTRSDAALQPSAGPEVVIVSYNIRGAIDTHGMQRLGDVAREIASHDPDVVLLQEVARGWPVFGAADTLAYLQSRLEMPYRFQPAADRQFGNAILSRIPFDAVGGTLPEVPGAQLRSYLTVRMHVGDRSIVVINTHLHGGSLEQIDAVLDVWGGVSPAVIAGDMNMQPDDEALVARFRERGLVDAEEATGDPCRTTSSEPTSHCDRPDWIWVTRDLEILMFRIGSLDASDHLPIHLTLAVGG